MTRPAGFITGPEIAQDWHTPGNCWPTPAWVT